LAFSVDGCTFALPSFMDSPADGNCVLSPELRSQTVANTGRDS